MHARRQAGRIGGDCKCTEVTALQWKLSESAIVYVQYHIRLGEFTVGEIICNQRDKDTLCIGSRIKIVFSFYSI